MKIFALATALLVTVASAAPAPIVPRNEVLVTFIGAAEASFTQYFSLDGKIEHIRT